MLTRVQTPLQSAAAWLGLDLPLTARKPTVLLAEDDPEVSLLACMFLKQYNFDVKTTDSGVAALHLARCLNPDIVVLDINLPGMNGLEICRQLKADPKTCAIPVVFCSGEGHLAGQALALGAAAFLGKPQGVLQLADCLYEILSLTSLAARN